MKKLSGWQKAGIVAGVGCLSIVGVLAVGLVAAVIWARSTLAERGDTAATRNERTIDLVNVSLENLGNARAGAVDATGGMGNLTADFGGVWQAGAISEVDFDHSMGELTVRVPGAVRLEAVGNAQAEAGRRPADATQADGPDAPVLRLRVSTSMGGSRVVRY